LEIIMAKFLDNQGVWMAWDYGNGPEVVNFVSEDPIAVMVHIQNEGMGFPGFWPERMSVPEALSWWRDHASEYVPKDRTENLEEAKRRYEAITNAWSRGCITVGIPSYPEETKND
jgi:hypothetical protein